MSQIMKQLRSTAAAAIPGAASLEEGQLAVNIADALLWVGDAAGNPVALGGGGITRNLRIQGENNTGGTITEGTVVAFDLGTPTDPVSIEVAEPTVAGTLNMPGYGIAQADIADLATGEIIIFGLVAGIGAMDLSTFTAGDVAYVGAAGTLTDVPPTAIAIGDIQPVGTVLFAGAGAGDGTMWVDFSQVLQISDGGYY